MKYFVGYVGVKVINNSPFPLPEYKTEHAAGVDVQADLRVIGEEQSYFVRDRPLELRFGPGQIIAVPTSLYVEIPEGFEIQIRPRSGLSLNSHLRVANAPGTIDSDYRGEIKVILENVGDTWERITHGDRIAQLVLCPVMKMDWSLVDELSSTERGIGGFGSTGLN